MKRILLSISICFLNFIAFAQTPFGQIQWTSGYQQKLDGEDIGYTSIYPDFVSQALLTRTNTGTKTIAWETAPVPTLIKEKYIYFKMIAAHSSGSSGGDARFDLYINDSKELSFVTHPDNKVPDWKFDNESGVSFAFQQVKIDNVRDGHGIAYLRVPVSKVTPGKSLKLKIIGQKENRNDWFMIFKYGFETKVDVTVLPFIAKKSKKQPVLVNVFYFGKKDPQKTLSITIDKKTFLETKLQDDINSFEVWVDPVATKAEKNLTVQVSYGNERFTPALVTLTPIIARELHFIHHSHTDVGYSHLQPQVVQIHNKNIRDALSMIEKTKDYPEGSKFIWNVESLWAVENFLSEATPEEEQKFVAAVKSGSICLSALYANVLTGQSMPEEMLHYTDYAAYLRKKYGFSITSAMATDVPGFSWTTVTALAKGGARYFSSGPNNMSKSNPYLGDRAGHFVTTWGDKPVWWTSPSGEEKVLFWTAGLGYSSWHGGGPGEIFNTGKKKIGQYMDDLRTSNYPYAMVQWRYNIVADNGPIDSTISDFVKQWNEQYETPTIVLNSTDQLFKKFEATYGNRLPVVSGDITPYWEDGAASTASEEGTSRLNSLRLQQLTTLYAMLNPKQYKPTRFYEAWKNTIMFSEHTWGAHNSVSAPDLPFVTEQWRIKKNFMLEASRYIDSLSRELLDPLLGKSVKKIAVLNTLSWTRSAPVYVDVPLEALSVVDARGKSYPLQLLSDGRKVFIAENLPPLSVSYFTLKNKKTKSPQSLTPLHIKDHTISNSLVSVVWDKDNGSIVELKRGDTKLGSSFKEQGLNAYWYVNGRDPNQAVSNSKATARIEEQGPYLVTVNIASEAEGAKLLERRISLWANDDRVFLENTLDKKPVRTKEGVYFAFPFEPNLKQASWDAGYGTTTFLKNQLPGANMDFIGTRRWLDVSNDQNGVQLLMKEAFLMCPDSMVDERLYFNESYKRWRNRATPTSLWFSYVMNNYWHTNYKADQAGIASFQYALRPHGPLDNSAQEKAAMEYTHPVVTLPIDKKTHISIPAFDINNPRVVVTSITPIPEEGAYIFRLFNPDATPQQVHLKWGNHETDVAIKGMDVVEWKTK